MTGKIIRFHPKTILLVTCLMQKHCASSMYGEVKNKAQLTQTDASLSGSSVSINSVKQQTIQFSDLICGEAQIKNKTFLKMI